MAGEIHVDLSATDHVPPGGPIRTAAETLVAEVANVETTTLDLQTQWGTLPSIYADTDHDDALYTAFDDPVTDAGLVTGMAQKLKTAADDAAKAFDDIRNRRNTVLTVDVPAAQALVDAESDEGKKKEVADRENGILKTTAQGIADDLATAEQNYATAVSTAMSTRPTRSVRSHFPYGMHDPQVVEAQQAYEKAMAPGAGAQELQDYYAALALLSPEQIEALGAAHPEMRTAPPPLPTSEADLKDWPGGTEGAAWWQGMSPEQQAALMLSVPALVGNTEGVPYTDRASANLAVLDLLDQGPALSEDHREDLAAVRDALANKQNGHRYLISLRHDNAQEHVLGALAIGNPDTAGNVTWRVPGMGAETNGAVEMMEEMQHIYNTTEGERAVVLWIGYDTPDGAHDKETLGSSQVLSNDAAYAGSIPLAYSLDGFQETRQANAQYVAETWDLDTAPTADPRFNVAAHSYGTPTAAYALTMTEHEVDTYLMYGSVGVDPDRVPNAEALNVARDANGQPEVYATQARGDHIAVPLGQTLSPWGGEQRISPTDDQWGAKVFSSDGGPGPEGNATNSHFGYDKDSGKYGYTEPGSQSLRSISAILNGQGDQVALIDQSWWDDLRENPASRLLEDGQGWVDRRQENAQSWVDRQQERHSWLPDAPVDAMQWGADQVVDLAQQGADVALHSYQQVAGPVVDAVWTEVENHTPQWIKDKLSDVGPSLYRAFEEGGLPTFASRTTDSVQAVTSLSGEVAQSAANIGVDQVQERYQWLPDQPIDWAQDKGNAAVDAAQDKVDGWIDDGQAWVGRKWKEWTD